MARSLARNADGFVHIVFEIFLQRVDGKPHPRARKRSDQIEVSQNKVGFCLDAQPGRRCLAIARAALACGGIPLPVEDRDPSPSQKTVLFPRIFPGA